MHLTCLTPTYGRPSLVRNALALFLAQQLRPGDTAHLLIWADDGLIPSQAGFRGPLSWEVVGTHDWIPLTRKYAPMLAHARQHSTPTDAWVVWDDDDVYLPWHLQAHAETLSRRSWSHPSQAWSTYQIDPLTQSPTPKRLGGRHYHGALAVRDNLMLELSGWPQTDRSDYDKQMLRACWRTAGPPGDPCLFGGPSYVYRWSDTGRDHCSARIKQGQYQPPRIQEPRLPVLTPQMDAATMALVSRLVAEKSPAS
jgi:hypothetical protein